MMCVSVCVLQLIGGDPDKDIAVLQLECETSKIEELKPISLGQSSNLLVGQKVYAIGNPFGLDHTLTQGIVSGVGRELNTPGHTCFASGCLLLLTKLSASLTTLTRMSRRLFFLCATAFWPESLLATSVSATGASATSVFAMSVSATIVSAPSTSTLCNLPLELAVCCQSRPSFHAMSRMPQMIASRSTVCLCVQGLEGCLYAM